MKLKPEQLRRLINEIDVIIERIQQAEEESKSQKLDHPIQTTKEIGQQSTFLNLL